MNGPGRNQGAEERDEHGDECGQPALEAPRFAVSEASTHHESQIEPGDMDQDALQNVLVSAQMRAPHPARVERVRKRSFDSFSAEPHQASAS
mgnify:CR=1 FL=1